MTHPLQTATAVAAGLVALAFAMSTYERWLARHRRHELAWSISLAMFAVASGALAYGSQSGWNGVAFRTFFLFGAIVDVPFLAVGTVYLLAGPRRGDATAAVVALLSAFAAGVVVTAPFTHPLPAHALPQGKDVFGLLPRVLAAVGSGAGAMVVFVGAVYSAVRFRRGRMVGANVLIAAGTAVLGAGGLLNSVLDQMTGFALTLVVGIVILFAGFLVASAGPRPGTFTPRAALAGATTAAAASPRRREEAPEPG